MCQRRDLGHASRGAQMIGARPSSTQREPTALGWWSDASTVSRIPIAETRLRATRSIVALSYDSR